MCGPNHRKCFRCGLNPGSDDRPRKCPLLDGQDKLRSDPASTTSRLADVTVSRWMMVDAEEPEDQAVGRDMRYAGLGYSPMALVTKATLACDAARDRPIKDGGCDWDNLQVLGYKRRNKHLNARRFCRFRVEDQALRVTRDEKSRGSVYCAWNKRVEEWERLMVFRAHLPMNRSYLRDRCERDYVKTPDCLIRDLEEVNLLLPGTLHRFVERSIRPIPVSIVI